MESICRSDRLCKGGARILFFKIAYPSGISERADRYYSEAAEAFEQSCREGLFALALDDYNNDENPRKKYRHRPWEAVFLCALKPDKNDETEITLTVAVSDGRREFVRREFRERWRMKKAE